MGRDINDVDPMLCLTGFLDDPPKICAERSKSDDTRPEKHVMHPDDTQDSGEGNLLDPEEEKCHREHHEQPIMRSAPIADEEKRRRPIVRQ